MTQKLRAPFVWTPRQAIDPAGYRKHYLGAEARPNEKNRWFLFRKTVRLDGPASRAPFSITVDGRYILYVNGVRQGRGPVRCSPLFQRYDDYDLAGALQSGDNIIAVLVHTYGVDTAFYETTKGMWQPTFGNGGLWADGVAHTDAGEVSLSTHEGWRCLQSDAWTQDTPQSNHSLGFIEDFEALQQVLISEPRDLGSQSTVDDALSAVAVSNTLIYWLNVDRSSAAEDPIPVLTRYTGGRQYALQSRHALEDAITRIGEEIHGQYLLSYTPANTAKTGFHHIRVVATRSGVEVRSRPGYWISQ